MEEPYTEESLFDLKCSISSTLNLMDVEILGRHSQILQVFVFGLIVSVSEMLCDESWW